MIKPGAVVEGDCLEKMGDIEQGSIDLIISDLPYGTTALRWDSVIPFPALWEHYRRLLKPTGAVVLTASQPFTSHLVLSNPDWFRCEWIWEKSNGSNFASANKMPLKVHENILVFAPSAPVYNPQKTYSTDNRARTIRRRSEVKEGVYGEIDRIQEKEYDKSRYPRSVQKFKGDGRNNQFTRNYSLHPTQKPVALFEYLIRTYSNEGDLVLDNCAGAGTTAIAAINSNRRYILIEKAPEYVEITRRRIAAHLGEPAPEEIENSPGAEAIQLVLV